jgi:hypothetical protein
MRGTMHDSGTFLKDLSDEENDFMDFLQGEWCDVKKVEKALRIDFSTAIKIFDHRRDTAWCPAPLNGQYGKNYVKLKSTGLRDEIYERYVAHLAYCNSQRGKGEGAIKPMSKIEFWTIYKEVKGGEK